MSVDALTRRTELLLLRERLVTAVGDITSGDDGAGELTTAIGDHLADHASDTFDRELDDSLEQNASQILREIDDALERLDAGTYGVCAACGKEIPPERLDAVPYATLCVEDKRLAERG